MVAAADKFPPIGSGRIMDTRIDFEGLVTGSDTSGLQVPQRAYTQVFRSGIVEAVVSSIATGWDHNFLVLPKIQATIIDAVTRFTRDLGGVGIEPPFFVSMSMIEVAGKTLLRDFVFAGAFAEDFMANVLRGSGPMQFGEAIIDVLPQDNRDVARLIKRPILDHLANAAGLVGAPYFDSDGNYTLVH